MILLILSQHLFIYHYLVEAHPVSLVMLHLFRRSSFGLLPSAINHTALHPPSCTSGEVGPLPFTPLCITGMWHASHSHTLTLTHTNTEGNTPPTVGCCCWGEMCRTADLRPHTQTVIHGSNGEVMRGVCTQTYDALIHKLNEIICQNIWERQHLLLFWLTVWIF